MGFKLTQLSKATINFTEKKIYLEATSVTLTAKLIVKITAPNGQLVYQNEDWGDPVNATEDLEHAGGTSLVKDLLTDTDDNILEGKYTIEFKQSGQQSIIQVPTNWTSEIYYRPEFPKTDIKIDYSCASSTMVAKDNTNWILKCLHSGKEVVGSDTTYSFRLYYPNTMEEIPDPNYIESEGENPAEVITVTPIYTKIWVARAEKGLVFVMPPESRSNASDILFSISGTLKGSVKEDVACAADCLCSLYDCVVQVVNTYLNLTGVDTAKARELESTLMAVIGLYLKFITAERCGSEEDILKICKEIQAWLNKTGYACCTGGETEFSKQVVPFASGSLTTGTLVGGSKIFNGAGSPDAGVGNNGDYYIQTDVAKIWAKSAGTWNDILPLTFEGLVGNAVYNSDFDVETINSNTPTIVKSYTLTKSDIENNDETVIEFVGEVLIDSYIDSDSRSIDVEFGSDSVNVHLGSHAHDVGGDFPLTVKSKYYIQKDGSDQKLVLRVLTVEAETGIVAYRRAVKNVTLGATTNIIFKATSDNVHNISLLASYLEVKQKIE